MTSNTIRLRRAWNEWGAPMVLFETEEDERFWSELRPVGLDFGAVGFYSESKWNREIFRNRIYIVSRADTLDSDAVGWVREGDWL